MYKTPWSAEEAEGARGAGALPLRLRRFPGSCYGAHSIVEPAPASNIRGSYVFRLLGGGDCFFRSLGSGNGVVAAVAAGASEGGRERGAVQRGGVNTKRRGACNSTPRPRTGNDSNRLCLREPGSGSCTRSSRGFPRIFLLSRGYNDVRRSGSDYHPTILVMGFGLCGWHGVASRWQRQRRAAQSR